MAANAYFGNDCKTAIIDAINGSKKRIDICMYAFTDMQIANLLISKGNNDIEVNVVLDDNELNRRVFKALNESGVSVKYADSKGVAKMHHKFCIIDSSKVLTGSYNYTISASIINDENLNLITGKMDVKKYIEKFNKLFSNSRVEKNVSKPSNTEMNYLTTLNETLRAQISRYLGVIDENELIDEGYTLAKENEGNVLFFEAKMNTVRTIVSNQFNQNAETRVLIKAGMENSYTTALTAHDNTRKEKLSDIEDSFSLKRNPIEKRVEDIQKKISVVKGEIQDFNDEIKKIEDEKENCQKNLDQIDEDLKLRPFWNVSTAFLSFISLLVFAYLIFFFASAIYKLIYEFDEVSRMIEIQRIRPPKPSPFKSDALIHIFSKRGVIDGMLVIVLALIPIFVVNVKLIYTKLNKFWNIVYTVVGIVILDVAVALYISKGMSEINNIIEATNVRWEYKSAFSDPDFYKIFFFGALPLLVAKLLFTFLSEKYRMSNPYLIDDSKGNSRKLAQVKIGKLNAKIRDINRKKINPRNNQLTDLNTQKDSEVERLDKLIEKMSEELGVVESRFALEKNQMRELFEKIRSQVDSGNQLVLVDIIAGRIDCLSQGWQTRLLDYYHNDVANERIRALNASIEKWKTTHLAHN